MDDHYSQVMDRIKVAEKGGLRSYFGYSSVLDRSAFDIWKKEHGYDNYVLPAGELCHADNVAIEFNFMSRWWGGRVAGLAEKPGGRVMGLLIEIRSEDWPIIEHKEGVITGVSVAIPVVVTKADGQAVHATAFTTNPARISKEGPISDRYLSTWTAGARSAGIPEEFIKGVILTV